MQRSQLNFLYLTLPMTQSFCLPLEMKLSRKTAFHSTSPQSFQTSLRDYLKPSFSMLPTQQVHSSRMLLIHKHPCLKTPGSYNGCYGWQQRLKYKMGNYRTKLRGLGCPELDVNSLRKKRPHEKAPAKNVKRPKKAEVNYLPLSTTRRNRSEEMLNEVRKRDNSQIISEKMAKTFSIRKQEVVNQEPAVSDVKERWPALFDVAQINQEFRRITTVALETTFLAKLDQYSSKIMSLLSSRGGAAKLKIRHLQSMVLEV
ncbi:hypothetical protein AMECASPLE_031395 [Ameca splendens]|uniref:Uncharacterized protein n=1 Tax=Ameca splendens TaxID=208324 RepID=A0ABV1A230_9TELE